MSLGINIIFLLNKNAQDKLIIELLVSLYERLRRYDDARMLKPKFRYADFATKSGTSSRQSQSASLCRRYGFTRSLMARVAIHLQSS